MLMQIAEFPPAHLPNAWRLPSKIGVCLLSFRYPVRSVMKARFFVRLYKRIFRLIRFVRVDDQSYSDLEFRLLGPCRVFTFHSFRILRPFARATVEDLSPYYFGFYY